MFSDIDSISRNKIVSETDKNFFVEAGAGSGKTTMLVNRMVAMVENGIDISRISAITFTKAAAGEFYKRFQKILIERSNPDYVWKDKNIAGQLPKPTQESRKNCEKALKDIDLCFMGTIDSFCNVVLSEHPSEAKIPSDASIIEDDEFEAIIKQEFVKISGGQYGIDMASLAKTFSGMHFNPAEAFVKGMSIVQNNRNVHFNFTKGSDVDIDNKYASQISAVQALVDACLDHPEIVYDGNKDSIAAYDELQSKASVLRSSWTSNTAGVINALKKIVKLCLIKDARNIALLDDSILIEGGRALKLDIASEDGIYTKLQALRYDVSMTFISKSVPFVEKVMHDTGRLNFFDYLYYLREMLKNDAEGDGKLIRYIYDRHSYFLIDEFQDTNPMQAEVFFYLTAANPVSNWRDCDPRPGSLFIVGDPKQSIYRFRSADVTSFLNVKRLFEAGVGEVLMLTRNFRSTKPLCEYFNARFTDLLPEQTDTQSKFEPIPVPEPSKVNVLEGAYYYDCYEGDTARDRFPELKDEVRIVDIIKSLVGNPAYQIVPDGEDTPRPLKFKDFMIILPSKRRLPRYIKAFKDENLPVRVEGKVPFESCEALKAIYAVYAAVADTRNKIALNRTLKSILFRFTNELLATYKNTGRYITLDPVSYKDPDSLQELKGDLIEVDEVLEQLRTLSYKARSLSPAALFVQIMDDFRIYKIVSEDNLEVVYYTLELIRSRERDGSIVTLKDGSEYIKLLMDGESEQERCLSLTDNSDCIHMANLHKVKGLEAPVVILAYAWTFKAQPSLRIEHNEDGSEGYIFNVSKDFSDNVTFSYFETKEFDDEEELETNCLKDENNRLVYVAATRARNVLIASKTKFIYVRANGETEQVTSGWSPLFDGMQDFMPLLTDNPTTIKNTAEVVNDAKELYETAAEESSLKDRTGQDPTYEIKNPSHTIMKSKMEEDSEQTAEKNTSEDKKNDGRKDEWNVHKIPALIGTMTHRFMEKIISSKNTIDKADAIDEIIREYRMPVYVPFEEDIRKALMKVSEVLGNGGYDQKNNAPKDIIATLINAEEVFCEVPFCYKEEIKLWNGVMDVIYRQGDKWHILDYKTNADGSDLDIKYQGQLEAYIKAFKVMTGEDADAMTYHIDI